LEQINEALKKAVNEQNHDIYALFDRFDADGDGCLDYQEMQRLFEWVQLGFSPKDYYEVIRFADKDNQG
jgi:Ca2+-binding EF-hand superfamily protein